jgi:hypothetical protein
MGGETGFAGGDFDRVLDITHAIMEARYKQNINNVKDGGSLLLV